jgi:polar amino acid transport system substrate-binding protein
MSRFLAIGIVGVLALSACSKNSTTGGPGASSTGASSTGTVGGAVGAIKDAGTMLWCSDVTYPPEEFFQGGKAVGSDIDIGTEIAKRAAGVGAEFKNTGFDGIIPALLAKKCDAIISGMNDTAERRQQVAFVDYLSVGQSLMVKGGNPLNINSLESLSGHSVAVEVGTTNADFLKQASDKLKNGGKAGITIQTFPKDTDAATALKNGRVDAYFGDSPVVAFYIQQDPQSFAFGGQPVNPLPVGIAIRQDEQDLVDAAKTAVDGMYSDGKMCDILAKWKLTDFALKGNSC